MASKTKGDSYRAEAEQALNRTTIFGFGKTQKFEDAAELFTKAGNAYKLSNEWKSAGKMFLKAADCHKQIDNASDSTNAIVEAGNCYKKISPSDAVKAFSQAIERYNENGRFSQSAKYHKEIAEIYEADSNTEQAMAHYQNAADLFMNDNKRQSANPCLLKIATLASADDNLLKAAEIYESIGRESLESRLGAYSAKGYFFQCLLCHMAAGDNVASRSKLDTFKGVDYSFPSSRECGLVEALLQAMDDNNDDAFAQACADFDRISPLDGWKTSMLLKAKRHIVAGSGEDGDVDLT